MADSAARRQACSCSATASRSSSGRCTRGWRKQVHGHAARHRASSACPWSGLRFGYNLLWLASFALGSLGALLLFAWPPLLKTILSALFIIIVVALLWGVLARFLLSPQSRRLRVFPVDDASARHWTDGAPFC